MTLRNKINKRKEDFRKIHGRSPDALILGEDLLPTVKIELDNRLIFQGSYDFDTIEPLKVFVDCSNKQRIEVLSLQSTDLLY